MEVNVTDINNCEKSLEIKVPYSETIEEEKAVLEEYQKEVKVAGFREGKAPISMIKKMFDKKIESLLIDKLVNKHYIEALKKENIIPINEAKISSITYNKDEGLNFIAVIEVEPVFGLASIDGIKVRKEIKEITEDEINEEVEKLRYQFGTREKFEDGAQRGHFLLADIQEIDSNTKLPLIGKKWENRYFRIGDNVLGENTDEELVGLKTGDKRIITRQLPKGITEQTQESRIENLQIEVKNVENIILPKLDDEFAKDVNEKFNSLEELNSFIRKSLEERAESNSNQNVRKQVEDEILKRHDFDVPNSMVENYLNHLIKNVRDENAQNVDEEFIRTNYRNSAVNTIKWYWIKEKLIKENDIKVEESEITEKINKYSEIQGIKPDEAKAIFKSRQAREKIKEEILDDKLFDFILEKVELESVKV